MLEDLLRPLAPQVLGAVVRRYGHFDTAEDAVQEALLAAASQWPAEGIPASPRGWLITVAARRLTDMLRAEQARRRREDAEALTAPPGHWPSADSAPAERDDTLTLLFLCTLAAPAASARAERLAAVRHVLYLIFSEGYAVTTGAGLLRADLCIEAIRLTRLLRRLLPQDTETAGLLALMLLTDARRPARTGPGGELIPMAEQDRSRWDRAAIGEGLALITATLRRLRPGPFQLQAAIAAVHDEAQSAETTDWPQILALYELLRAASDNPVVALNHAVAAAMVHGPHAGLDLLASLAADARLASGHRFHAVRAHLLELAGETGAARSAYLEAAQHTTSLPHQRYLHAQADRLGG